MDFRIAKEMDTEGIWKFFQKHAFHEDGINDQNFIDFVHNMYYKNPSERHYQIVAEDGEDIVAHEAVIPIAYKFFDQELVLGLGSNTLIDEKHRQMLLFLKMQNYFFKNYTFANLDFTYGLVTRQDVLKIHLKTGYKKIGDVFVYARPYRIQKIIIRKIPFKLFSWIFNLFSPLVNLILRIDFSRKSNVQVITSNAFLPEWDQEITKLSNQFKIAAKRSSSILNWRFNSLSYRKYKTLVALKNGVFRGYVVVRPMMMQEFSSLAIVDLLAMEEDSETINALLAYVHNLALEGNVDLVSTILPDHSIYKKYLSRRLFLKTPEFFSLVADQPKNSSIKISQDIFTDWHINWFDHDFV